MNNSAFWAYFDASALVKRYVEEVGTALVNEAFVHVPVSRMMCADDLLLSALGLVLKHNLNATDAAVLRSALNRQQALRQTGHELLFWTCDKRLIRAAQSEGLSAFDPETETLARLHELLGLSDSDS